MFASMTTVNEDHVGMTAAAETPFPHSREQIKVFADLHVGRKLANRGECLLAEQHRPEGQDSTAIPGSSLLAAALR
jgi:hypothetical protein